MEPDFQKAYILWDAFPQTVPAAARELMRRQVMPLSSDELGTRRSSPEAFHQCRMPVIRRSVAKYLKARCAPALVLQL